MTHQWTTKKSNETHKISHPTRTYLGDFLRSVEVETVHGTISVHGTGNQGLVLRKGDIDLLIDVLLEAKLILRDHGA